MDAIFIIDKPKGMTSHDVVQKTRNLLNVKKVGHAGTLDPLATGLLPICVGRGTKLVREIMEGEKEYEATLKLGVETASGDLGAEILREEEPPKITKEELEIALKKFRGSIIQKTPSYSAVKYKGKRLYTLARQGKPLPEIPRQVVIYKLEAIEKHGNFIKLRIACSIGTYIRALLPDIAKACGTCGVVTELQRTRVGRFSLKEAAPWAAFEEGVLKKQDFTTLPGYVTPSGLKNVTL
ncbi:MAG: tRNA pseudouridine(55) synthase TruB [bacterium]|nr:tRNA pseudouridine(55) synthase TruB [bacterium]